MSKHTILFIDDDADFRASTVRGLTRNFQVIEAGDADAARAQAYKPIACVLLDIRLDDRVKDDRGGLELLRWFKEQFPSLPVVMMTALDEVDVAVQAMKLGADDFILKSKFNLRELVKFIENAIQKNQMARQLHSLRDQLNRLQPTRLTGTHPKIQEVGRLIQMVASDGHLPVLIRGDTGTGKEVVAHAIHTSGVRRDGPFVAVSLSALPKEIVARELFGHEKGAFTDAKERGIGYIERADGGILFLDEIGELTPDVQVQLLRVLETQQVTRIGSTRPIQLDFQLVAATNRDLERAVTEGDFRRDLYFRLKAIEIYLPPLAERPGDIPLLVSDFLDELNRQGRTKIHQVTPEALACLEVYPWPGNVRELKRAIETTVLRASLDGDDIIDVSHLPVEVQEQTPPFGGKNTGSRSVHLPEDGVDIQRELGHLELAYIEEALQKTDGKKTEAWKLLGYNDRYAMKRRVSRMLQEYPDLISEFDYLRTKY
ncbi:sigma-54-dependent Fis family transcriptional regulator [Candidatus Poribacteria bacterium]|nr:sigma-54-dependent Fis family transcriptional regulator [Candidatus Poribacteria bacterium]